MANKLYTWGYALTGTLGNGTTSPDVLSPTQIGAGEDWDQVSHGSFHVLAIRNGELWVWGSAFFGRLGNGTTSPDLTSPTRIGSDSDWQVVSAGQAHSLAIKNGALYAWGNQQNGRLGDGQTSGTQTTPVQIGNDTDWTHIAAGQTFSLGIRDGKLYGWGQASRLGLGLSSGTQSTPIQVGSETDWSYISSGNDFSHGIRSGTLWAWGQNGAGQLGDGSTTARLSPVQIGSDSDWQKTIATQTSSGSPTGRSTLAIKGGKLYAWGANGSGQLGDNSTTQRNSPVEIDANTGWTSIAISTGHGLAIRNGALYSWGLATFGRLGNGTTTPDTLVPAQVGSNSSWTEVATASAVSMALESAAVAPTNSAIPTITTADAILEVGSEMTSTDGTWTGTPAPTYAYQWQVSDDGSTGWANISGATSSSLTLVSAQGGKYVRLEVTATNTAGSETAYSAASAFIAEDPVSVVAPTITGTAKIEETLTADPGTWTGFPTPNFSYQWERSADGSTGWANISAATSATYELGADDKDKYIRVTVTGTNDAGTASASAEPAGPVQGGGSSTAAIVGAIRVAGAL